MPVRRSAGNATNAPTMAQTTRATITPAGVAPSLPTCDITTAPMPTKLICANEIWPAKPVSGTSDNAMMAKYIALTTGPRCGSLSISSVMP